MKLLPETSSSEMDNKEAVRHSSHVIMRKLKPNSRVMDFFKVVLILPMTDLLMLRTMLLYPLVSIQGSPTYRRTKCAGLAYQH